MLHEFLSETGFIIKTDSSLNSTAALDNEKVPESDFAEDDEEFGGEFEVSSGGAHQSCFF